MLLAPTPWGQWHRQRDGLLRGGIAVAVGVYTHSRRVMMTVGDSLLTLTPLGAFVVVVSHSLVLFIFTSTALEGCLAGHGLPTIPLLPVSGSQAVIGSVVGIGLLQGIWGIRQIKWKELVGIASGWITTPLLAAVMGLLLMLWSRTCSASRCTRRRCCS